MEINRRQRAITFLFLLASILFAILVFQCTFGLNRVNPNYIRWQFRVDPGAHYFAWVMFRNSPWTFPIGKITDYGFPNGSSVGLADAIPLLAISFKCLGNFLPVPFQYFGGFIFFNLVMQAFFSFFLGLKIFWDKFQAFLFSIFFILCPPFLFRISEHAALTTQWPLLVGFMLLLEPKKENTKVWFGLFVFLTLIHPYLWVMLLLQFLLHQWLLYPRNPLRILQLLIPIGICSTLIWLGIGTLGNAGNSVFGEGISKFNANLNTLINSYGFSSFLPGIAVDRTTPYEGFGYLGLGGLFWVVIGLYQSKLDRRKITFLVLSFCIAVSVIIRLNDWFTLDLFKFFRLFGITQLASVFRCTGRFIWLTWYGLVIWAAVSIKQYRSKQVLELLITLVVIQAIDLIPLLRHENKLSRDQSHEVTGDDLLREIPATITDQKVHFFLYPSDYELHWLRFAAERGLTTNFKQEGRDDLKLKGINDAVFAEIVRGETDPKTLYAIQNDWVVRLNPLLAVSGKIPILIPGYQFFSFPPSVPLKKTRLSD